VTRTDRGRVREGERGSVMVVALAFMVVIATLGVAVLAQQSSASNVQGVYTSAHRLEYALDGAVTATLQGIRYDELAGRVWSEGGTICSGTTQPGAKLGGFAFAGQTYDIHCAAAPGSGARSNLAILCAPSTPPCRLDRMVRISVCEAASACLAGRVRLRVQAALEDRNGEFGIGGVPPDTGWGAHVSIKSWTRNPPT